MLKAIREQTIINRLLKDRSVKVKDLAQSMHVTEETIRRDLKTLEKNGIATRTHGGAILKNKVISSFSRSELQPLLKENKIAIAELAKQYITNNICIFIDSSTTAYELIQFINNDITLVTNSLDIISSCSSLQNFQLIGLGGNFNPKIRTFSGSMTKNFLSHLYFDIVFLSCRTLDMKCGLAESNYEEAELKRMALDHAKERIALIDHTKFNHTSFIQICDIDKIDVLITDKKPTDDWINYLKEKNVKLLYSKKTLS